jgi:hypothetical protein
MNGCLDMSFTSNDVGEITTEYFWSLYKLPSYELIQRNKTLTHLIENLIALEDESLKETIHKLIFEQEFIGLMINGF